MATPVKKDAKSEIRRLWAGGERRRAAQEFINTNLKAAEAAELTTELVGLRDLVARLTQE